MGASSAAATALATTALARELLRRQARTARATIHVSDLGEEAHVADRTYKKKYGDPLDLLLLGDSIAAGLGADRPSHTLGAQLASRLAKATGRSVRLHTAARVGSESSMLPAQLDALPEGYHAEVAVVVVGGNDVTHRVRIAESTRHLGEAVTRLRADGTAVVVGTCPDLGALRPVPQPLRSLGSRASRQLAIAQREVATSLGAHAVSLATVVGPFFVSRPDEMFALDRFHPSSAGYRRTAKALLPSVLAALGHLDELPFGHHPPAGAVTG
ncbi:SGNH/GDSL hydrolase family protein [Nocardioides mesophilus]|uniref:SGNH/GDSL hydrolase family protein n=1 Tax=Nocardioides mesophilus TaxID=433659 RepID=A0A7G9RH05_9ACTN|nr:SGNH/GDSL hydrolase family protein [Nocardioides mesophilus]